MRKSIPMLISKKHLRGDGESPRRLIGMSFRLGIPWQVALQQSLPPLSRPQTFCKNRGSSAEQISADGACLTSLLSQKGPQSTPRFSFGLFQQAKACPTIRVRMPIIWTEVPDMFLLRSLA